MILLKLWAIWIALLMTTGPLALFFNVQPLADRLLQLVVVSIGISVGGMVLFFAWHVE